MSRTSGLFASFFGLAALAAVIYWLNQPAPPTAGGQHRRSAALPVSLARIEERQLQPSVSLTGTVRAPARVALAFEVAGLLAVLEVQEGEHVGRGQLLARLDSRDEELGVALAEAEYSLRQNELERLQAATRPEVLARLEAELAERRARVQLAAVEVARQEKLQQEDIVSRAIFDEAQAAHAAALALEEAARQALEEARAGTRPEDLAVARARLEVEGARLAQARRRLQKTELRAPYDGVVLRRGVAVGAHLSPGQEVLELVDLSKLEVAVEIPSHHLASLGERPRVTLMSDRDAQWQAAAFLDVLLPAADEQSRNFRGLVRFQATDAFASLKPGMFVRVNLELRPIKGASLPTDALRLTDEGTIVVVAEAGDSGLTARWVPVDVRARAGQQCIVVARDQSPLMGEQAVVTGVDLAYPGAALFAPAMMLEERTSVNGGQPASAEESERKAEERS